MNIQKTLSVVLPWDLSIQTHAGIYAIPFPPRVADLLVLQSIHDGNDGLPDMGKVDAFLTSVIPSYAAEMWYEEEKLEAVGIIAKSIAARKKKGEQIRAATTTSTPG